MKLRVLSLVGVAVLLSLPVAAQTLQSGIIAGVAKDTSGAVLPGVTVEASSPALIEKTRSVTTDSQGVYRIVDLRPGTYSVTFSLQGFNGYKRDGIELSGGFTATVNADMAVGTVEETVTVSGAAPIVDVQNIIQQQTISREVRDALPLPSNSGAYVTIIPGATQAAGNQDVGGNQGENKQQFTVHGSRTNDFQQLRDGQYFGTMVAAGNFMSSVNPTTIQEVNVLTAGGLTAESETGGAQINVIPRDGGNIFSGAVNINTSGKALQSDNLDAALQARGATTAPYIKTSYELAGGVGGPIKRDTLWFFGSARRWINESYQPGNYFNATQGTPFYTPDLARNAFESNGYNEQTVRLTYQAPGANKFSGSYSVEQNCNCYFNIGSGTLSPEATGDDNYWPNWRGQITWNQATSNRTLYEAGGTVVSGNIERRYTGSKPEDISILDTARNYRYNSAGSNITGFTTAYGPNASVFYQFNQHFTVSYVTGSHSVKTGIQARYGHQDLNLVIEPNVAYTFNGKTPTTVTYFAGPYNSSASQQTIALFGQDQWTIKRLTLNYGARFDYLNGWIPAVQMDAGTFVPARDFPVQHGVLNWKDISPRLGVAYDLFGDGKTAVKAFLGRYVGFQANGGLLTAQGLATSMVTSATRAWTDNGDYIPQANELGPLSNSAFGTVAPNTTYANDVTHGWGTRDYSWQAALSLQRELRPGLAINVAYYWTSYGNFTVTNNTLVTNADYDPYCITAPTDSRLPSNVSGQQVCGLYDLNPAKTGQVSNLVEKASKYGDQIERYNGIDVTMNSRFRNGQLSGGLSTGSTLTDDCAMRIDSPQQNLTTTASTRFCHTASPWGAGTQVKFAGLYQLPQDFKVSATFLNIAGIPTTAQYVATNAQIAPSLGRNLSSCRAGLSATACTSTVNVDLIENNQFFTEGRNTQVNLRLTRLFRFGRTRLEPQFDLFNLFNSNQVLVMTTRYASTNNAWQNVSGTGILAPRVIRLGVQVNF